MTPEDTVQPVVEQDLSDHDQVTQLPAVPTVVAGAVLSAVPTTEIAVAGLVPGTGLGGARSVQLPPPPDAFV